MSRLRGAADLAGCAALSAVAVCLLPERGRLRLLGVAAAAAVVGAAISRRRRDSRTQPGIAAGCPGLLPDGPVPFWPADEGRPDGERLTMKPDFPALYGGSGARAFFPADDLSAFPPAGDNRPPSPDPAFDAFAAAHEEPLP